MMRGMEYWSVSQVGTTMSASMPQRRVVVVALAFGLLRLRRTRNGLAADPPDSWRGYCERIIVAAARDILRGECVELVSTFFVEQGRPRCRQQLHRRAIESPDQPGLTFTFDVDSPNEWLTTRQASARLCDSARSIRRHAARGTFPFPTRRVGKSTWLVSLPCVLAPSSEGS